MKAFRWTFTGILLIASSMALAASADGITITHYEPLERLTYTSGATDGTAILQQKVGGAQPVTMSFDALGQTFDLDLEPNLSLLPASSWVDLGSDVSVYRGTIAGEPASWTRIVVANGMPRGLIWDGRQMFAVESPDDGLIAGDSAGDSSVIYRLADMLIEPGSMSCSSGSTFRTGADLYSATVSELKIAAQQAPGAVEEMSVGLVGDFLFTDREGSGATTALVARINNVDGIFSSELQVQLTAPTIETFPTSPDPFDTTTDSGDLVDDLGLYREGNPIQNQHGLTHMFTGRTLAGTTVGVAYIDALCLQRYGAGLSEGNRGANTDALIAAHEIGHNFSAIHDGVPGTMCENEPDDAFLMAPSVNGSMEFSPCSKTMMSQAIANARGVCINPLPSIDMTIGPTQTTTILLGQAANVTFDVLNNGTLDASNVNVDITLPANISLIAASGSQGNCTSNSTTVSCAFGNVSGSSGGTVTVTANTIGVGPAVFTAAVTADVDDVPTNNQGTLQVNVDPAVELGITSAPGPAITVNQSTNLAIALENTSILDASAVTLSVTLSAGLEATSANWALGGCTVAATQVDCVATTFGSQSTSTMNLAITGVSQGAQSYDVSIGSAEADANTPNNAASATVTVRAENNNDDEGSGAIGALFLALLGGALIRRRYVSS